MISVGIVTFHYVNNFGGVLQSYALFRTLDKICGTKPLLVDYRNWFIRLTDTIRLFPITGNKEEWVSGWKTMKPRLVRLRKFRNFTAGRCRLSGKYRSRLALRLRPLHCEVYLCGSDQVWNPYITFGLAAPYFLNFAEKGSRKVTYAPSFGTARLCLYGRKKIKKYLHDFADLSVREKTGKRLLEEITGRQAAQLIDPVFLLDHKEWEKVSSAPGGVKEGGYILLYLMQQDRSGKGYRAAKRLKEKLGIPLVEISRYGYCPDFADISLVDTGPEEFIWLFSHAAYICTNSYHGLAFSLIFEKNIFFIPCRRFYERISSLLELVSADVQEKQEGMRIIYKKEAVRSVIAQQKELAVRYLRENIVQSCR